MRRLSPLFALVVVAACKPAPPAPPPAPKEAPKPAAAAPKASDIDPMRLVMFQPLPADAAVAENPFTDEKIALGRMLYYEPRLSKNHDVSCNSCHLLDQFGVDGQKTSKGHKGQLGGRNSPSVYNAALHFVQFWDGRAATVEEQAKGPMLNPVEMAMPDDKKVVAVLSSMPEYVDAFKKAFPEEKNITLDLAAKAIGAFERKLVTPSRWDKFLGGDKTALNDAEKEGFNKFVENGCVACHLGPSLGGGMYQKLGLVAPWPEQKDQGRFEVTKSDADKMMFKVPGLRNITKTAPYYHDGSVATIEEAIKTMGKFQLGRDINDADAKSIATFLETLTGEIPAAYIAKPELPKSTPKTPKADPS